MPVTFYRPRSCGAPYFSVGDYAQGDYLAPSGSVMMVKDDGGVMVRQPLGFTLVWSGRKISLWQPQPPAGYVALGHLSHWGHGKPSLADVRVVREDCVVRCEPWLTWTNRCSGMEEVAIWSVAQTTAVAPGTFISVPSFTQPPHSVFNCIKAECVDEN